MAKPKVNKTDLIEGLKSIILDGIENSSGGEWLTEDGMAVIEIVDVMDHGVIMDIRLEIKSGGDDDEEVEANTTKKKVTIEFSVN